ncbi:MAG TPA: S8 family serine peptidase [bacterium]
MLNRVLASLCLALLVSLSFPPLAWCPEEIKPELDLSVTGYFRVRGFWVHDRDQLERLPTGRSISDIAALTPSAAPQDADEGFLDMRLMINPEPQITDNIHVNAQFRILDNFLLDGAGGAGGVRHIGLNPILGLDWAGRRDHPAESLGLNGVIVATGNAGRDNAAVLYGPSGAPFSWFTERQLNADPDLGTTLLNPGCDLSGRYVIPKKDKEGDKTSGKQFMMRDLERWRHSSDAARAGLNAIPGGYQRANLLGTEPELDVLIQEFRYDLNQYLNTRTAVPVSNDAGAGGAQPAAGNRDVVTDDDVRRGVEKLDGPARDFANQFLAPGKPQAAPHTPSGSSRAQAAREHDAEPEFAVDPRLLRLRLRYDGGMTSIDPPTTVLSVPETHESILDDLEAPKPLNPHQPSGPQATSQMPDGTTVRTWQDGTREISRPDGSQDVIYPDGARFHRNPDGSMVDTLRDGSTVARDRTGKETGRTAATGGRDDAVIRDPHSTSTEPPKRVDLDTGRTTPGEPAPPVPGGSGGPVQPSRTVVTDEDAADAIRELPEDARGFLNQFLSPQGRQDVERSLQSDESQQHKTTPRDSANWMGASQPGHADGHDGGDVQVERAWAEVKTPVGRLDFGRMGSHWGMGLFANDGNRLDLGFQGMHDDAGDTMDRVKLIMKFGDLYVTPLIDRVIEDAVGDGEDDVHQYLLAIVYRTDELRTGTYDGFREQDPQAHLDGVPGQPVFGMACIARECTFMFPQPGAARGQGFTDALLGTINTGALHPVVRADAQQTGQDLRNIARVDWGWTQGSEQQTFAQTRNQSDEVEFDWETIVPRLGLAYALGNERRTLLRASYSRFADQLGTSIGEPSRDIITDRDVLSAFNGLDQQTQQFLGDFLVPDGRIEQPLDQTDSFGSAPGGPLVKDTLWFFDRRAPHTGTGTQSEPAAARTGPGTADLSRLDDTQIFSSNFYLTGLDSYANRGFNPLPDQSYSGTRPFMPQDWQPRQLGILPLGCSHNEKATSIGGIRQMWDGQTPSLLGFYFGEPIFWFLPQDDAVRPNDPLYQRPPEEYKALERKEAREDFKRRRQSFHEMAAASMAAGTGMPSPTALQGPTHAGQEPLKAIDQWGLRAVGFTPLSEPGSAWAIIDGMRPNVTVAVIDSGLDLAHPDGPAHVWTNPREIDGNGIDDDKNGYIDDIHGWNFVEENADLTDRHGHGTLVAGIIAAQRDNGIGIAGINPGARIMPLKVLDEQGKANSLNLYRAIHYAVDHGARVLNISLGNKGLSHLDQLAVNYAHARGAIVIVAAGNQGDDIALYGPASLRRVLAVAASNVDGARSGLSNRGPNVALTAPGQEIYSLHSQDAPWPGDPGERDRLYRKATGTSFAAPIVAATASLLIARDPHLPNWLIEDILMGAAGEFGAAGWDPETGWGMLDARRALGYDVGEAVTVLPAEVVVARDKKRIDAVSIYGVVRGVFSTYTVELGKGARPDDWTRVAGPSDRPVEYGLLAEIPGDALKKGKAWTVRITATRPDGRSRSASLPLSL